MAIKLLKACLGPYVHTFFFFFFANLSRPNADCRRRVKRRCVRALPRVVPTQRPRSAPHSAYATAFQSQALCARRATVRVAWVDEKNKIMMDGPRLVLQARCTEGVMSEVDAICGDGKDRH